MLFDSESGPDRLSMGRVSGDLERGRPQDPSPQLAFFGGQGPGKSKKRAIGDSRPGGHQPEDFLLPIGLVRHRHGPPTPCSDRFQTRRCGVERGGLLHVSGLLNAVILML